MKIEELKTGGMYARMKADFGDRLDEREVENAAYSLLSLIRQYNPTFKQEYCDFIDSMFSIFFDPPVITKKWAAYLANKDDIVKKAVELEVKQRLRESNGEEILRRLFS